MLTEAIQAFLRDEAWTHELVDGVELHANDRARFAAALLAQVHEHAVSIRLLLAMPMPGYRFGSAGALVRPTFESLVRALWILDCATDDQVKDRSENDERPWNPGLKAMCAAVDEVVGGDFFSMLCSTRYNAMCSYAHGGLRVAARNLSAKWIEPTSTEPEWTELVVFAHIIDLLSTHAVLTMASRMEKATPVFERAVEVWSTQPRAES